ncbi:MAG TPA: hypothetical protein VGL81_13960 [Polyangiaceae bacterium]|jgi:hypothetical protein
MEPDLANGGAEGREGAEQRRLIDDLVRRHVRLLRDRLGVGAPHTNAAPPVDTADSSIGRQATEAWDVTPMATAGVEEARTPSREMSVNPEPSILVNYKEAAQLLSLCRRKPSDVTPEQAEKRGVDALKQRVAAGRIPERCIKRSGRRVQFVRAALVDWANGRGRGQR